MNPLRNYLTRLTTWRIDQVPKQWLVAITAALALWLFYAILSPGLDFFGCYTRMVQHPEDLALVPRQTWTLNPAWVIPFLALFVYLPAKSGFILLLGVTLGLTLWGAYIFKGRPLIALLSHQMWWVLYWGQLEGFGILGLLLAWFGSRVQSWWMMALALLVGSFKPQLTFVPILLLWWWSGKARVLSAGIFGVVLLLSLLIWGPWPLWYLQAITSFVGGEHYGTWNASIGILATPLFIPALILPMDRLQRVKTITATSLLVMPYLPYYSTLPLLVFTLPWPAYLLAFSGYLVNLTGTTIAWNSVVLLPIITLIGIYYPFLAKGIRMVLSRLPTKNIRDRNE